MIVAPTFTEKVAPSARPAKAPVMAEAARLLRISKLDPTAGVTVDVTVKVPPRDTGPAAVIDPDVGLLLVPPICTVSFPVEVSVKAALTARTLPGLRRMLPLLVRAPAVVKDWPPARVKLPPARIAFRPLRLVKVVFEPLSVTRALAPMVVRVPAEEIFNVALEVALWLTIQLPAVRVLSEIWVTVPVMSRVPLSTCTVPVLLRGAWIYDLPLPADFLTTPAFRRVPVPDTPMLP